MLRGFDVHLVEASDLFGCVDRLEIALRLVHAPRTVSEARAGRNVSAAEVLRPLRRSERRARRFRRDAKTTRTRDFNCASHRRAYRRSPL
jgi:hypothetical protein